MKRSVYILLGISFVICFFMGCRLQNRVSTASQKPSNAATKVQGETTGTKTGDTSYSQTPPANPGGAKADTFDIEEVVSNYETLLTEAINNNDFSLIQNLILPNSKLYNSQKNLVFDLHNKGIQEKLQDFDIFDIKNTEKDGVYKVYVNERIGIKYPDKQTYETKESKWIYTVESMGDMIGLSDIEKWAGN